MADEGNPDMNHIRPNGHRRLPKLVHGARRADDELVRFVKKQPAVALVAALAIGYVLGRVFTRAR